MITFFRKIRQRLLSNLPAGKAGNRVTRYLAYSLGEILLVVIGILIALGVNNWNQDRISGQREEKILHGLYLEFNAAAIELEADLNARKRYLRAADALQQNHLTGKPLNLPADSIRPFVNSLISSRFYSTAHPILNELSSSGSLELIQSDSIRLLLGIYIQEKNRYTSVEEREGKFTYDQFIPFLSEIIDLSAISLDQIQPTELDKKIEPLQLNNQFGSLIYMRITRVNVALQYGKMLSESIENILRELEKELNY